MSGEGEEIAGEGEEIMAGEGEEDASLSKEIVIPSEDVKDGEGEEMMASEGEEDAILSNQIVISSKKTMVSKGTRKSSRLVGKRKLDKFTNEVSNPVILDAQVVGDDVQGEEEFSESPVREERTKKKFDTSRKKGDEDERREDSLKLVLKRNDANPIQQVKGKRERVSKVLPKEVVQEESGSDESSKESVPTSLKEIGKRKRQKSRTHKSKREYFCTRTSPKTFFSCIQELSDDQKRAVEEMGFGSLLQFKVDGVPSKLGLFVVDNFDEGSMELNVNNHRLQITKEAVHDMFGIPMGETKIQDVVSNEEEESSVTVFKRIHGKEYVTPHVVLKYIRSIKSTSWYFRMNFLILFANMLGECMRNGNCNTNILIHIKESTDVSKLDWCTFILDCLVRTKRPWNKYNPNSTYTGPITFLMLFYVDSTFCPNFPVRRSRPATKVWTMELLKGREEAEVDGSGLGFVDILPPYVEPVPSVEPPACNQPDKVEDYEALIDEALSNIEKVVKDGIVAFPNINLWPFKTRCEELFASVMVHEKRNEDSERCDAQDSDQGYKTPLIVHVEEDATNMIDRSIKNVGSLNSVHDFFVPDFSLLSQQTPPQEKQASDGAKGVEVAGKEIQKGEENKEDREQEKVGDEVDELCEESKVEKGKRNTKPSLELKSPFLNRAVQVKKVLTVAEKKVSRALFSMKNERFDVIFASRDEISCVRLDMETLVVGAYISCNVIDTWSHILNREEPFRSIGSPLRFFGTTSMFNYKKFKDLKLTEVSKYNGFKEELKLQIIKHKLQLSLRDIDMIFFPILQDEHFWLLVFNLKNPACIVLDNSGNEAVFEEKYMFIPQAMQTYLTSYMEMVHYPRVKEIKALKPERWEMDCRTLHNKIDCGVFLMRHMEVYKGEPENKWDCGIGKEISKQQGILEKLRARYATKILLSDVNLHKEMARKEAEEFAKLPLDDQEGILFKATLNMQARWDCKS